MIIFHIDVNSAYLSWTAVEQLKNGAETDIRTIPAIIGGDQKSRHGIVLAKSIPAKKYGIRTGEPVANAFRKCPGLHMEPPDHKMYHQRSQALMDFLRSYTPDIEQVSVDECYMDFTGIKGKYISPVEAAFEIKDEVKRRFGFTVNIGISDVKVLAKMASDFQKPDRVHTLFQKEIQEKMWPLPVSELFMAGHSSVETLKKLEIYTIGDLARSDPKLIELHLKSHGRRLWEFANGIDDSVVEPEKAEAKGIGNSTTLSKDVQTVEEAGKILLGLAQSVGARLRKQDFRAGMVNVEIKYSDFTVSSHQKQLEKETSSDQILYQTAMELFQEMWNGKPIRLLGIRTSKLTHEDEPRQLSLFDMELFGQDKQKENRESQTDFNHEFQRYEKRQKQEKLDAVLDQIRQKYGDDAVIRGSFMKKPEKAEKRDH